MDPKHLVYLAVILDKGSITAASQHLRIAQPTLTRAMATLEMQAGTQLFSRSRFGVKSTAVGEALGREGRAIMHSLDLVREQVSRFKLGLHEELRIATGSLFGFAVMPDVVDRLTVDNPRLTVVITTIRPNDALDGLIDNQFDVAIAPAPHDKVLPGIHRKIIVKDRIGIYCSPSHPLAKKEIIEPSDLDASDWLSLGMATTFERQVIEFLMSAGVKNIRTKIVFNNDTAMLIKLLSRGKHLSVLPVFPIQALRGSTQLVKLDVRFDASVEDTERNIYIWSREEIRESSAFLAFEKAINDTIADLIPGQR